MRDTNPSLFAATEGEEEEDSVAEAVVVVEVLRDECWCRVRLDALAVAATALAWVTDVSVLRASI